MAPSQRELILAGIRTALGASESPAGIAAQYEAIPREYVKSGALGPDERIGLFVGRLEEYDAGVYRCSPGGIAAAVAGILEARGKSGLVIPAGVPREWLPSHYSFVDASEYGVHELDAVEGVLTACTVAIAETGTIVLQNAAGQGKRMLSLVPDYHLCVVFESQVVATVPEGFAWLRDTATLPTTFVSGPSATADIEMTRIKGVHGPRFLDVLLVGDVGVKA